MSKEGVKVLEDKVWVVFEDGSRGLRGWWTKSGR